MFLKEPDRDRLGLEGDDVGTLKDADVSEYGYEYVEICTYM